MAMCKNTAFQVLEYWNGLTKLGSSDTSLPCTSLQQFWYWVIGIMSKVTQKLVYQWAILYFSMELSWIAFAFNVYVVLRAAQLQISMKWTSLNDHTKESSLAPKLSWKFLTVLAICYEWLLVTCKYNYINIFLCETTCWPSALSDFRICLRIGHGSGRLLQALYSRHNISAMLS